MTQRSNGSPFDETTYQKTPNTNYQTPNFEYRYEREKEGEKLTFERLEVRERR